MGSRPHEGVLPRGRLRATARVYWLMAFLAALAFFGCILLHELGHAVVARSRKMRIRGITLFLFGGVAEIEDEPPSAPAELLMAIAGPLVNVALAAILGSLAWLGYHQGWPPPLVIVLGHLAAINAPGDNVQPDPGLPARRRPRAEGDPVGSDGRPAEGDLRATLVGQGFAWILIAWGVVNFFAGNWIEGVWIGLIGLFLGEAAQAGYRQVLVRRAVEGEPVRRFMNTDPITVPPSLDLRKWVEDYVYRHHRKAFPVVSDAPWKA